MLGSAVIIFREVLEAALIIGLVLAVTRGVSGRLRYVSIGMLAGISGAVILALLGDFIAPLAEGVGQELMNASILGAAVIMLTWHLVWMKKHSQHITSHIKSMGSRIETGESDISIIAVIIGLAILREGSEVVLFMYGLSAAGSSTISLLSGGLLGMAAGILIGVVFYLGLARVPLSRLFSISGWLILLMTAGLAAQASNYLAQADLLPTLGYSIWDSSHLLSEQSLFGQFLHVLIGYVAQPTGIQILTYVATILIVSLLMFMVTHPLSFRRRRNTIVTAAASVLIVSVFLLHSHNAHATHKIYSPHVEEGEAEIELRGHTTFDSDDAKDGQEKYKFEVGYGFTEYWFSAIGGEIEKDANGDYEYEATLWENIFQLTEQGEYWVDVGLYLEYEVASEDTGTDKVEGKLLLEKNVGKYVNTANLILVREVGSGSSTVTEFEYAWRTKYLYSERLEPAIEIYGSMGELGSVLPSDQQDHRAGPVIMGLLAETSGGKWVYELGYLFGLSDAAPDGTLKFVVEYEFRP
jgi:FTR1 family protein